MNLFEAKINKFGKFLIQARKIIRRQGEDEVEFENFGLDIGMEAREVQIKSYSSVILQRDHLESMIVKIKKNCRKKPLY